MLLARWNGLIEAEGWQDDGTGARLLAAYAEPHRAYHTQAHLTQVLTELDRFADLADHRREVELALWFHDAFYDTTAQDNERRSAEWAQMFLEELGEADAAARVFDLVLATEHSARALEGDAALVVDLDLSILGQATDVYDRFELEVRREYEWVPQEVFRARRAAILQVFLERPAIYYHASLRERYEAPARANLRRALESLS